MRFIAVLLLALLPTISLAQTYPDETTTGVPPGTTLTNASGLVVITTPGFVYQNVNLTGCIVVQASNVIIRRIRIQGSNCGYSMISNQGSNLLIEDSDLICEPIPGTNGLTFGNYTVRRVDISRCENGMWAESNTLLEDSYIHDIIPYALWTAQDPHTDGVQIGEGNSNITIRHNRIYGDYSLGSFGNSAITSNTSNTNVLFEDNLVAGGGYTVRCEGSGSNTNYRVRNNRFSTIFVSTVGGFGPVNMCSTNATEFCGNRIHETNVLLSGQAACPGQSTPNPPTNVTLSKNDVTAFRLKLVAWFRRFWV